MTTTRRRRMTTSRRKRSMTRTTTRRRTGRKFLGFVEFFLDFSTEFFGFVDETFWIC